MKFLALFGILHMSLAFPTSWNVLKGNEPGCDILYQYTGRMYFRISCSDFHIKDMHDYLVLLVKKTDLNAFVNYPLEFYMVNIDFVDNIISPVFFEFEYNTNVLHLNKLKVTYIQKDAFKSMSFKAMIHLLFADMPLESLEDGALNGLVNLQTISFTRVNLKLVAAEIFVSCPKLMKIQMIRAGKKKLWIDSDGAELPNVQNLELQFGNMNGTILSTTFSAFTSIIHLYLQSNRIEYIGDGAFDSVYPTLLHLDLSLNFLKFLEPKLFRRAPKINGYNLEIRLHGNPWHCDCKLNELRRYVNGMNPEQTKQIQCSTPALLHNRPLHSLMNLCLSPYLLEVIGDNETLNTVIAPVKPNYDENPDQDNRSMKGFKYLCHLSNVSDVELIKSIRQIRLETLNGERFLKINEFPSHYVVIAYRNIESSIEETTSTTMCISNKHSNQTHNLKLKTKLGSGQVYRYCVMCKRAISVSPLNCITYESVDVTTRSGWILKKDQSIVIALCIIIGLIASIFGAIISFSVGVLLSNRKPIKQQEMITQMDKHIEELKRAVSMGKRNSRSRLSIKKQVPRVATIFEDSTAEYEAGYLFLEPAPKLNYPENNFYYEIN